MRNLIKSLFALFVVGTLLFVSCQNDENTVVETQDSLRKDSELTNRLKAVTFGNDEVLPTDNMLDSTNCFRVKFPYLVNVNGQPLRISNADNYDLVSDIFNASANDQDHVEFYFPLTVVTLEGAEIVVRDQQQFDALSVSCEYPELILSCFTLVFPINVYGYDTEFQTQQAYTFNTPEDMFAFLIQLNDNQFYQIRYPVTTMNAIGIATKINSNAELLSAMENAYANCDSTPQQPSCDSQNVLTNGLILYMPFANEAKDLVSNANAFYHANFPLTFAADRNGNANGALSMSGSQQDALTITETEYNHLKQGDSLTISVWFKQKLPDNYGVHGFFSKANNCGCVDGFTLGYMLHPLFGQSGGIYDISWTNEIHLDTQNWHHILITLTPGNDLKIYRDGVLRISQLYEHLDFGDWFGNYVIGKFFNGYLDDLRVYRRVLSDQEVQQLYNLEGDNNTCLQ